MSIYGHYNQQYDGNRIEFPEQSFTIAGISRYEANCKDITYNTMLFMNPDPANVYDSTAIEIRWGDKLTGYVPNTGNKKIKEMCQKCINEPLKIINIGNRPYGIRVIPLSYYEENSLLENEIMFADMNQT